MSFKLVTPLLLAGAFALAWSARSHSSEPAASGKHVDGRAPVEASLRIDVAQAVTFTLGVTNNETKRVELTFPNGQTHDITVLDQNGREVWRWSEGRLFTQAMRSKVLDGSETLTYEERWEPGARRGTFTAVASLHSASHPLEQRVEFTLR